MKKILSLLLAGAMGLSLCACAGGGESANEPAATFQVGYAREDITPGKPVPLAGYGNASKRISTNTMDFLYFSCVAITDTQDNTILLMSQDLVTTAYYEEISTLVNQATGVPVENIMLASTHTHSGPSQGDDNPNIVSWRTSYMAAAAKAAQKAMADRAPTEISIGRVDAEGLNFVRHYVQEGGHYIGDNFGSLSNGPIIGHAEENDPEMQVIKFDRTDEAKRDIVMVNWQAHPCITSGTNETNLSADFVGSTRNYVERETGMQFIYFQGAAGNHNAKSRIEGETPTTDVNEYGQLLGDYVLKALENMTPVASGDIKTTKLMYEGKVNHTMEDKLDLAKEVNALYKATDRDTANKLAREYGFSSVYHCNGVITRSSMGETLTMGLNAISIGDALSFITAPYEMFAAQGMYIKENTPYDMTFVVTYCNGHTSYLPTEKAYDFGCYESHTGRFERGTAEKLAETYVDMLTQLKG